MPFSEVLSEQMQKRNVSPLLDDQEREQFLAEARDFGRKFLQIVRKREKFEPKTGREGLAYHQPVLTDEVEVGDERLKTFVVPVISPFAQTTYMLDVRGISPETIYEPDDAASMYDNSRSLHEVMMISPKEYESPSGITPNIERWDKEHFEEFRQLFGTLPFDPEC
jgi:hypothetical protein